MNSESRQVTRASLRKEAFKTITADVGGERWRRRLMARSLGNRKFRAERHLPEAAHMSRRLGLRK